MLKIPTFRKLVFLPTILAVTTSCVAQPAAPALAQPGSSTLLQLDFNGANPWPQTATDVMPSTPIDVLTTVEPKAVGTIDVAGSTEASGAMLLKTEVGEVGLPWIATYSSGLMPVKNTETNLGKLTLAWMLSASSARPVMVRIESFGARKSRTGGLETTIYPAAPDFYQRFALDLSGMKAAGDGKFAPTDPYIQLSFELKSPDWPDKAAHELRIDNVNYAKPAYYVSPQGGDKGDGRTEQTAFASAQKAVDVALPGDIILVMNGTYQPLSEQGGEALFRRGGTPAAWITLKNYPGHQPVFSTAGTWSAVRIGRPKSSAPDGINDLPELCYIEVRGLRMRGIADTVRETHPESIGVASPFSSSNGVGVNGNWEKFKPHHIRIADNTVEFCGGGGLTGDSADWVSMENNIVRNNCWTTIYAGSGISFNGVFNFDGTSGGTRNLIAGNETSGNRTYVIWKQIGKISDGNGIIIDTNNNPTKGHVFSGRTLICNNVSFNNGGSGIHSFKSHQIDIINNTAYMNGASPELKWGQIFVQRANDVRIINNILWARDGQPVNTVGLGGDDKQNTKIVRANNLYFGGVGPVMGEGDQVADPMFVNPSTDPAVADFRLKPGSPALKAGRREPFTPLLGLNGLPRPVQGNPDIGAYQHQ